MTARDIVMSAAGASAPVATDPNFENVTLLLNGEPNESITYTAFSDASTNNFSITPNGDTYGTPFSPYNTSWSNYFDGSGDYLSVPSNAALGFGTGDFTMEAWVYFTSNALDEFSLFGIDTTGGSIFEIYQRKLYLGCRATAYDIGASVEVPQNSWTHLAITRSSNTVTLWQNGVSVGTGTITRNYPTGTGYIGVYTPSGPAFPGYISNLRITKGTAVYTGNFTPPSLANLATSGSASAACYSSTTNINTSFAASATSLLTCQSNRFIDNSSNNFAITVNGNTSISSNSPFTDTDTTTGSGYFDGVDDYLSAATSTAFSLGTGDFTIETWVYKTTNPGTEVSIFDARAGLTPTPWALYIDASNYPFFYDGTARTSTIGITLNTWNHIAVSRSSGTLKIFVNGVQGYSASVTTNLDRTAGILIGTSPAGSFDFGGYISNARIVKDTAVYTGNFTPPSLANLATSGAASAASYPSTTNVNTSFASSATSLLTLQTRGAVQNIGFIDSSPNKFPITKVGNTTQGTFSPYGNLWSNYFTNSTTNITVPSNTVFAYGTNDFTVECWVYKTTTTEAAILDATGTGTFGFNIASSTIVAFASSGTAFSFSYTLSLNTWNHIALVRSSGNLALYVNGSLVSSQPCTYNFVSSGTYYIGRNPGNSAVYMTGYISNLRIVKGTAVYISNFTPSTTPLTAVSGTSLLTCQSNRFIDNSSNNFTITRNGDVNVTKFSPFNPTAEYSASTIGGSGYFDGSGDYLSLASNTALTLSSDFTIEAWINTSTKVNYQSICSSYGSVSTTGFFLLTNSSGTVTAGVNGVSYINGTVDVCNGAWNHVAYVRSSGVTKLYINGVLDGTLTSTDTASSTDGVYIGSEPGTFITRYFNGYISNLRIVKGTAVYTSAFAPPTSPLTAVTGTSLLCNFTNAGVWDAAMMNDLEAVGNARIVTTVKKYNTGSMYFDGTGDYLYAVSNPNYQVGTGDFTIEFWVYLLGTSAGQMLFDQRTSATQVVPTIYVEANAINYLVSSANRITSSFTTTNSWVHVAVCRSGTSTKMFVNGTQVGSTYTDSNSYIQAPVYIGGRWDNTANLNGYIDDLRITKGYARYTANFTPPTVALPTY